MRAFVLIATLATLATPAAAFRATNGLSVAPTGPQDFTVDFRFSRNQTDYWCAAAQFVTRELGLSGKTRIYRAPPEPRLAGQGVAFTLDAASAAPGAGISSSGGGDGSVSAAHARGSFCNNFDLNLFDR